MRLPGEAATRPTGARALPEGFRQGASATVLRYSRPRSVRISSAARRPDSTPPPCSPGPPRRCARLRSGWCPGGLPRSPRTGGRTRAAMRSTSDLPPGAIAAAHHISVRHLHTLFRVSGVTVSDHVRHRRLERIARTWSIRRWRTCPLTSSRPAGAWRRRAISARCSGPSSACRRARCGSRRATGPEQRRRGAVSCRSRDRGGPASAARGSGGPGRGRRGPATTW